ncbi:hypothetical protein [Brucella intermedia]|uniref:hypothetical protein n=1 Tax=Brucella intermedia TaxID=94625 RepID=UPI001590EE30|nr:hypothetical protein [Brucella intermedia]
MNLGESTLCAPLSLILRSFPELVEAERLEGLRETALRVPSSFEASLRSAPQDEGEAQR